MGLFAYDSLQIELRKRRPGASRTANYVFGREYLGVRYGFRRPWINRRDVGTEGGVDHAFKATWVFELPLGHGRRFGGGAGPWLDRLIGGWDFDGITVIQSGRQVDFGNVRLVGMTKESCRMRSHCDSTMPESWRSCCRGHHRQHREGLRRQRDVVDGYGGRGAPTGRYLAPANGPNCIEVAQTNATTGYGDCGAGSLVLTGPVLMRFDLAAVKRIPIAGRVNMEFRAEFLNAFNTPWFSPVATASSNPNDYRVTAASAGREVQLVWRLNW
jgi:hypothetical protein